MPRPLKVTAPPLEKGILVRKDLSEETQGCVSSSCLAEEEMLILLANKKQQINSSGHSKTQIFGVAGLISTEHLQD